MEILNHLLRLLGMSGRRANKEAQVMDKLPQKEPKAIELSSMQQDQVEARIAQFIEDSSSLYAHAHGAIARVNALPLFFDWTGFMALRLDGQIVWVPYDDEPGEIEVVQVERVRNMGLFQGTRVHPDLQFLLPQSPPDAIICPDCQGTGKLTFPHGWEQLADRVLCFCGGIGWLPHGERR
jgi:hypothetical protein